MNVTIDNINASFTGYREESSMNSLSQRFSVLKPPREPSCCTIGNTSASRRDTSHEVLSSQHLKSKRSKPSLLSDIMASPNLKKVPGQVSARAKKRKSSRARHLRLKRLAREEEALKKERKQLELDRKELEEHRRKVQLLVTLQQQKLERASSPIMSSLSSPPRSRLIYPKFDFHPDITDGFDHLPLGDFLIKIST